MDEVYINIFNITIETCFHVANIEILKLSVHSLYLTVEQESHAGTVLW